MVEPTTLSTLAAVLAGGSGAGNVWFWYDKKRSDRRLDELVEKITAIVNLQTEHENKFITETKTRELLQEYLHNLEQRHAETSTDVKEMKKLLSELNTELRIINAVQNVAKEYEHK